MPLCWVLVTMHFALCSLASRPFSVGVGGCARRRPRQWYVHGWFLEIMQYALCLRARRCSAVACTAGFAGVDASRAVSFVVVRPEMLCVMAGMD